MLLQVGVHRAVPSTTSTPQPARFPSPLLLGYTAAMDVHSHPLFHDPRAAGGPPVTDELVAAAEATLGVRLPPAYVSALRVCNGGELRRGWLSTATPLSRGRSGAALRDMLGIGGYDGTEVMSPDIVDEWDLPEGSVVLSSEGPQALVLDYGARGPQAEPLVKYVDSDEDRSWTVAPTVANLFERLEFRKQRTEVALLADLSLDAVMEGMGRLGGEGPARRDHGGGHSLTLVGREGRETGPTLVRARPNRRPDIGALYYPELPEASWLLETTVTGDQVAEILGLIDTLFEVPTLLLYAVPPS